MRKIYYFISVFFLLSLSSFAQEATIKGKLIDETTKESLIGVNVILEDGTGAATDIDGNYEIKTTPGTHTLTFKYIGYTKEQMVITVAAGETKNLNKSLKTSSTQLNMVVVSASKFEQKIGDVAVSMEVIKPELIENKNTYNVETAVDQCPGVTVMDGQVSIRGGSGFAYGAGSRVLLMVDDLPLLAGDAGDVKWNFIPVENIEQIEVIKGASSVLFGSSALNGVINIRTGFPKDKPQTKVSYYHGIYDSPDRQELKWWDNTPFYTGMNFFHSRKIEKNFDLVVGGSLFSDQGYRELEEEHRGRINFNTRYRSKKVEGLSYGLNVNAQTSNGGLFLIWESDSTVYSPYGGTHPDSTTISEYKTYRTSLDPYITYYTKNGVKHSLRTRYFNTTNRNNTNQESVADFMYAEYQFQKRFDNQLTITSGLVGNVSTVNSQLYGDHKGNNVAFFTQLDKKYWDRFNISLGFRGEYFKIDTVEIIPTFFGDTLSTPIQPVVRAGMTYQLFEETYLRASYGQGYRFPSIGEKFVATSVGPLNIFPNPNLQPERGSSAEIGIKQGLKVGEWVGYVDVAAFWTEYTDMMEFTFGLYLPDSVGPSFIPTDPGYVFNWVGFRAENVQKAQIKGIDATIVGSGNLGKVKTTILAGYTYMNPISPDADSAYLATYSDTVSNILKYRFNHLIKGDIQFDYKKWSLGFSARYNSFIENIDKTFEDLFIPINNGGIPLGDFIVPGLPDYRDERNKGDAVFDLRLSHQITPSSKLAFIVNNALNREVMGRPGDVQAPRTYAFQYSLNF